MKKAQVLNFLIVLILSLGLSIWSLAGIKDPLESGESEGLVLSPHLEWETEVTIEEISFIQWGKRDAVIFFPNTKVEIVWDEENEVLSIELLEGSLVYGTLAGDFSVEVFTPFATVTSQKSAAWIQLEESELKVHSLQHPNLVSFVFEEEVQNALLIPTGTYIEVPQTKVTPILSKLRLTKLSKEFPLFTFEFTELPEEIQTSYEQLQEDYEHMALSYLAELQSESDFGPPLEGFSGLFHRVSQKLREFLTFLPHAEAAYIASEQLQVTRYLESNLLYGSPEDTDYWFTIWSDLSHSKEELILLEKELFFVLPGDKLYPLKLAVSEQLKEEETLEFLQDRFNEIEQLLSQGNAAEAEEAYTAFQEEMKGLLRSGYFDAEEKLDELSREYLILEVLLRTHSQFYNVEDVVLLTEMEEAILLHSGKEEDLNEARQSFVQSRLRFLENLVDYVKANKVDVDTAVKLGTELLFEAEEYLNALTSEVAVQAYFEEKIEEYWLTVQFMDSPEFSSYSSFEEGLDAFEAKQDELNLLSSYLNEVQTGEAGVASQSLEEALSQAEKELKMAGIKFEDLESLGDSENRLFELEGAEIAGYSFQAKYDLETHLLYEVVLGDIRFPSGLQLSNFEEILVHAAEEEGFSTGSSNGSSGPAIEVSVLFEEAGFDSESLEFPEADTENQIYSFELAYQGSLLAGRFDAITEEVSEISLEISGSSYKIPSVSLGQLQEVVDEMLSVLEK